MARAADDVPAPEVEFIDDGLTDDERADALEAWLAELEQLPAVEIGVRAADTLAEARAEREV